MKHDFKKMYYQIIHFLFPSDCVCCHKPLSETAPVCPSCLGRLPVIKRKTCKTCSMPMDDESTDEICDFCKSASLHFTELKALCFYETPVIELVHALKFGKRHSVAAVIADAICKHMDHTYLKPDIMIPIPLHKKRLSERGFNQSEEILSRIAKKMKVKYLPLALKRKKTTQAQSLLHKNERAENIKGAFTKGKQAHLLKNRHLLLFDDVTTTGVTINEACSILKECSPASIRVLTFAKAL